MFKIFLKPDCHYCAETVSLLKKYKLKYKSHTEPDPEKREHLKEVEDIFRITS